MHHHASMWSMMEHNWGMQFDNLGYWGHQDEDDDLDEESFDGEYHHIVRPPHPLCGSNDTDDNDRVSTTIQI